MLLQAKQLNRSTLARSEEQDVQTPQVMHVTTRSGAREPVSYDKIKNRYSKLAGLTDNGRFRTFKPLRNVAVHELCNQVFKGLYDDITTRDLDNMAANHAAYESRIEPEYEELSRRISISNHNKTSTLYLQSHAQLMGETYSKVKRLRFLASYMYSNTNDLMEQHPLYEPDTAAFMMVYAERLNSIARYDNDYNIKYAGFRLLREKYMLLPTVRDVNGKPVRRRGKLYREPVERVQDIWLRVAVYLTISRAPKNYKLADDAQIYASLEESRLLHGIPQNILHNIRAEIQMQHTDQGSRQVDWQKLISFVMVNNETQANRINDVCSELTQTWDDILATLTTHWQNNPLSEKDWEHLQQTYIGLSELDFMQATPTLFNSGTLRGQLSSCYLLGYLNADSVDGISEELTASAKFGKNAGGLGSALTPIRASGSYIAGTGGISNGLQPLVRTVNALSAYIDQGGGKRSGSHALYIEPWHADIVEVLNMRLHASVDKPQSITFGMYINDEFMRTVLEENEQRAQGLQPKLWYLFDPNVTNYLWARYDRKPFLGRSSLLTQEQLESGDYDFTRYYRKLVAEKKYVRSVSAVEIWTLILKNQEQTGTPYVKYKDNVNRKNNQVHYGVMTTSNLCNEIDEFVSPLETAVCNLASICLPRYLAKFANLAAAEAYAAEQRNNYPLLGSTNILFQVWDISLLNTYYVVDIGKLINNVQICVRNLDRIIDINYYPVDSARTGNHLHRPCGLGIQGWADVMNMLLLSYEGPAIELAFRMHELIYYTAVDTSTELARELGAYPTYAGSPFSQGLLQPDLWLQEQERLSFPLAPIAESIRENVKRYGMRNSLLTTVMPNASTSTITGFNNSYEPYSGIYYTRKNNVGEFIVINDNLVRTLRALNLWNANINTAIGNSKNCSISEIESIPQQVRFAYRTAWEIPLNVMDRWILALSPFVDQSISYNIFVAKMEATPIMKHYMFMWMNGAKTAAYYCRSRAAIDGLKQVTVDTDCVACS